MLATLRIYQDRVLAIAGEAESILRTDDVARLPRLVQLRSEQAMAMAAYQLFVHREVFAPTIRHGPATEVMAAKELKVACIALANALCHHMREWTRRDAVAEWAIYRAAATALIAELRDHVAQVRETLIPALDRRAAMAEAAPIY